MHVVKVRLISERLWYIGNLISFRSNEDDLQSHLTVAIFDLTTLQRYEARIFSLEKNLCA